MSLPRPKDNQSERVTIYTDGGCLRPNGRGGWAYIVIGRHWSRENFGSEPVTTNNRMEITAALLALRSLTEPAEVTLYSDSQYLVEGASKWIRGWQKNGWRTKSKQAVKNEDLWRLLDAVAAKHAVEWRWVRGHNGDRWNERCDLLATQAIQA
jgi:ribonuclease HI